MLQIYSRNPTFPKQAIAILVSGVFAQLAFASNPEYEAPPLDEVVVSASGYEQKIMDTAASINLVTINQIQNGQARDNLSEPLNRVPASLPSIVRTTHKTYKYHRVVLGQTRPLVRAASG